MASWNFECFEYRQVKDGSFQCYSFGGKTWENVVNRLADHMTKHRIISYHIQPVRSPSITFNDFGDMHKRIRRQMRKIAQSFESQLIV